MSASPTPASTPRVIALPETLDLPAAATLTEAFLKNVGEPLAIDASRVQRLGSPCLQVLLAAARTWKAAGVALTLDGASPRFLEDLKWLGCERDDFLKGAMTP